MPSRSRKSRKSRKSPARKKTNGLETLLANGLVLEFEGSRFELTPSTSPSRGPLPGLPLLKARRLSDPASSQPSSGGRDNVPSSTAGVDAQHILDVLRSNPNGLRLTELAASLDVAWQSLTRMVKSLVDSRKLSRRANGKYVLPGGKAASSKSTQSSTPRRRPLRTAATPTGHSASRKRSSRKKTCTIANCRKEHYAKGLCNNHYNIERRRKALTSHFDLETEAARRKAYRVTILKTLEGNKTGLTLYDLSQALDEKWQTLRQPASELVRDQLIQKRGKLYLPIQK